MKIGDIMDNYKIAFIYGINDDKRKTKDGQIEIYGDRAEDTLHSVYLLEHIEDKYADFQSFKKLNYRHTPETISYFLTRVCHYIIFLNTTSDVEKYGKTGLVIMPDKTTDNQINSLSSFCEMIPDYRINLCYDCEMIDGIFTHETISPANAQPPKEIVEEYLKRKDIKKKVR